MPDANGGGKFQRNGEIADVSRIEQAEWLEWSGLPLELNGIRQGGWTVFRKLVELDCEAHSFPGTVEVSLTELGERCGYPPDKLEKILEALRKKKYLRCFIPENADEEGLFEIRVPLKTPIAVETVAERITNPRLRDPSEYRYMVERHEEDETKVVSRVQEVVDLYFNHLSQKMNAYILEQIEIAARRFPMESIRLMIERAERHEIRSMGWVLKELIRDHAKQEKKKKKKAGFELKTIVLMGLNTERRSARRT